MRVLFIGDIVGSPGLQIVEDRLQDIIAQQQIHLVIANGENAASGFGITPRLAQELFSTVNRQPTTYKRIEWLDEREGPLPNPDVGYPTLSQAAAFFCTDQACSAPVFGVADLIEKMSKK